MTQKEKLFIEVNELSKQYKTIIDENGLPNSSYYYGHLYSDGFKHKYKVTELRELVETYKKIIDTASYEVKVKRFYETVEGKLLKTELETKINNIETEYWDDFNNTIKYVKEKILSLLPNEWGCNVYDTSFNIGLKDPENENGFLFGYSFDAHFNTYVSNTLEFNYGTMGGFDPLKNTNRVEFLKGLVTITSNSELICELNKIYADVTKRRHEYYKTIDDLTRRLKYPIEK
jgi:hypothetical protein